MILFSHPADFTPVCTTEFVEFARRAPDFERRGVALLGNSVDSVYSHIAWVRNIEEKFGLKIPFPVIADLDQKDLPPLRDDPPAELGRPPPCAASSSSTRSGRCGR